MRTITHFRSGKDFLQNTNLQAQSTQFVQRSEVCYPPIDLNRNLRGFLNTEQSNAADRYIRTYLQILTLQQPEAAGILQKRKDQEIY